MKGIEEYTGKDGIPIQTPKFDNPVTLDSKNHIITDYNWGEFYKMDREEQIDTLEFILQSLKELPTTLRMHERSKENPHLTRNAGM